MIPDAISAAGIDVFGMRSRSVDFVRRDSGVSKSSQNVESKTDGIIESAISVPISGRELNGSKASNFSDKSS